MQNIDRTLGEGRMQRVIMVRGLTPSGQFGHPDNAACLSSGSGASLLKFQSSLLLIACKSFNLKMPQLSLLKNGRDKKNGTYAIEGCKGFNELKHVKGLGSFLPGVKFSTNFSPCTQTDTSRLYIMHTKPGSQNVVIIIP